MSRLLGLISSAVLLAAPAFATAPSTVRIITLPAGTPVAVRLDQPVSTRFDRRGSPFVASLAGPVVLGGNVVLPRGARCRGHVVESKKSGHLKGHAILALRLDSIDYRGRVYPVAGTGPEFVGRGHKKHNERWIGGGAGGGAVIGAIAGGPVGLAIGAGAGAVGGTAGAAITAKRNLTLAPETRVVFTLRTPVTIRETVFRASAESSSYRSQTARVEHRRYVAGVAHRSSMGVAHRSSTGEAHRAAPCRCAQ